MRPTLHVSGWCGRARGTKGSSPYSSSTSRRSAARILDARGRVVVDDPAAIRALVFMVNAVNVDRVVPSSALTWQEEQVRFAFQNGEAAFMRNWPYAWTLLQDESRSRVARRFAVAPFPAGEGGRPAAALGGAQLAINAASAHPALPLSSWRF